MGGISATMQNSTVQRIDTTLNLLFLRGPVPGYDGNYVKITDSYFSVLRTGTTGVKKGLPKEGIIKNVKALPFPMGDMELAKTLPVIVDAAADKIITGRLGL
jgi:large subunit ribosomal protein L3